MKDNCHNSLFYNHFWDFPCDCGYYYSEERKNYIIYAQSKEIAKKVIKEQKHTLRVFIFFGVLTLLMIPAFIVGYINFQSNGDLTLIVFCLAFSVVGLITIIINAINIRHLRRLYKKKVIFLPKN